MMFVTYDPTADALYVSFQGDREDVPTARMDQLDDNRNIDYDATGAVIGVEFLAASEGIDLRDVPEAEAIAAALRKIPRADGLQLRSA